MYDDSDQDRVEIVSPDSELLADYFDFTLPSLDLGDLHSENNSEDGSVSFDRDSFLSSSHIMANTEQLIAAARNYADIVPRYNGDAERLVQFINMANKFFNKYGNTEDETLNDYTFGIILSKLEGAAGVFASTRPDIVTWPILSASLKTKFADHTDRLTIAHMFKNLTINSRENLIQFIDRIKSVQAQLNLKIISDPSITQEQQPIYVSINEQTALEILYNNSPPLLQTLLEVREFASLSEATPTVIKFVSKHSINKTVKSDVYPPMRPNIASNNYTAHNNTNGQAPSNRFNQPIARPPIYPFNRPHAYNSNPFQPRQNIPGPNRQNNYPNRNFPTSQNHQPPQRNIMPPQRTNSSSTRINFDRPQFRQWRQPQVNLSELDSEQGNATIDENNTRNIEYNEIFDPNNQEYEHDYNNMPQLTDTSNEENVNFRLTASEQ